MMNASRSAASIVLGGMLVLTSGVAAHSATTTTAGPCNGQISTFTTVVPGAVTEIGGTGPVVNNSPNPTTTTYTVSSTKTIGGSVTAGATVSASAGIAQVEATVGASFHYDVSTSTSIATQMTVQPGATGEVTMTRTAITATVQQHRLNPDCGKGVKYGEPTVVKGSQLKTVIA